jgi:hypothetical protein
LQSLSGLANSFYLDKLLAISLWIGQLSTPGSNYLKNISLDLPALFIWIKLLAISLWISQRFLSGLNFLQYLSGFASSFYLD